MTETVPFYSTAIPLAFFIWGPVLVVVLFWAVGVWSNRQGVPRMLESDWDGYNVADVEKLFTLYGEDKRARYRNRVLPADVACAFTYAPGVQQRNGIVSIRLTISGNDESVTLLQQVDVLNSP